MALRVVTPPSPAEGEEVAGLITLAQAKAQLNLETTDYDDLVNALILAATDQVQANAQRRYLPQSLEWVLQGWGDHMVLPVAPGGDSQGIEVSGVTYVDENGDTQTLDPSIYWARPHGDTMKVVLRWYQIWPWLGDGPDRGGDRLRHQRQECAQPNGRARLQAARLALVREPRRSRGRGQPRQLHAAALRGRGAALAGALELMATQRMRERVAFQARTKASDGAGNTVGAWNTAAPICTVSARLRPINGREEVMAQKLQGTLNFELLVRYSSQTAAVTPSCRAVNARTGETYDIRTIQNPDERNAWLSMIVTGGAGDS